VEGVSGLYALYFPVQDVTLDVAGTGTARVNAERTIRAKASWGQHHPLQRQRPDRIAGNCPAEFAQEDVTPGRKSGNVSI
jgi:hypothetical protein